MAEHRIATAPINFPRSVRADNWHGLTSVRAGVINPIAFFPLLPEDRLRGSVLAQIKMEEAVRTIINPIHVRMQAHLVSKLCMGRFDGSNETLYRSFAGMTLPGGGAAPAWDLVDANPAAQAADDAGIPIFDKLGIHYKKTDRITADIIEAYWTMVNYRRRAMSLALPQNTVTDKNLAPAFWNADKFEHIKPSFDASMMEGAVGMTLNGTLPIKGAGISNPGAAGPITYRDATGASVSGKTGWNIEGMGAAPAGATEAIMVMEQKAGAAGYPGWNVQLSDASAVLSLANWEMAKKAQAFAKMRERYNGVPDEYLIDILMRGIHVPPSDFREPILLGYADTIIGQTERFATDGASLDTSVTNGVAQLRFGLNTPQVPMGGIVLVTLEIVPEQLYERVRDTAIIVNSNADSKGIPNALNDEMDPQKVEAVFNDYADILHATPTGIFGYQPLNADWVRRYARVGGRFKRPVTATFVEDRQRIWSVEKDNPKLSADFYMCPVPFPHTPFADNAADPFEVITVANMSISGLTVFGAGFQEDADHYDKVIAGVDQGRIVSTPPAALAAPADEAVEGVTPIVDAPAVEAGAEGGDA